MATSSQPRPRSSTFVIVLATLGALALGFLLLTLAGFVWGFAQFQAVVDSSGASQHIPRAMASEPFIGLVRLEGPIDATSMDTVLEDIDTFAELETAHGIFIEVNSPGGAVVASQEMFDRLLEVRKQKPVLAYYRDLAASGAYYATASASWIVANRGSMVGSIGVIMQSLVLKDLLEWARLKPYTIKTGSLKDAGSPLRDTSPADEEYLKKLLTDTHAQFMDDVQRGRTVAQRHADEQAARAALKVTSSEGSESQGEGAKAGQEGAATSAQDATVLTLRDVPLSTMDKMRDGRVVLGTEALELGLVDATGSKASALDILRKALRNDKLELEEFTDEPSLELFLQRYLGEAEVWMARVLQKAFQASLTAPSLEAR